MWTLQRKNIERTVYERNIMSYRIEMTNDEEHQWLWSWCEGDWVVENRLLLWCTRCHVHTMIRGISAGAYMPYPKVLIIQGSGQLIEWIGCSREEWLWLSSSSLLYNRSSTHCPEWVSQSAQYSICAKNSTVQGYSGTVPAVSQHWHTGTRYYCILACLYYQYTGT